MTEKNTNIVEYGTYTPEAAREEIDNDRRGGKRTPFVKFAEGNTSVRILPPLLGRTSPFVKVVAHRLDTETVIAILGLSEEEAEAFRDARGDRDYPLQFVCPKEHLREKCPACEWAWPLYTAGKKDKARAADKEVGYQALPKPSYYCVVIVRGEEEKGPQIWRMSKRLRDELAEMAANPKIGNFSDPGDRGYDIVVSRKGTGAMDTRYSVAATRSSEPLSEDGAQSAEWLRAIPDLSFLGEVSPLKDIVARISEFAERDSETPKAAKTVGPTAQDDIEDAELV